MNANVTTRFTCACGAVFEYEGASYYLKANFTELITAHAEHCPGPRPVVQPPAPIIVPPVQPVQPFWQGPWSATTPPVEVRTSEQDPNAT